jgi:hypothetical protein
VIGRRRDEQIGVLRESIVLYYGIAFIERIAVPWAPKN